MAKPTSHLHEYPVSLPFRGRVPVSRLPAAFLSACFRMLLTWQTRARARRHLQYLDDYLLKDIGLTRADVEREACKPFWRT